MIYPLARNIYVLAALSCCLSIAHAQVTIMTMGDSITRGFPNDSESYPKYLRDTLTTPPIFVGDPGKPIGTPTWLGEVPDGLASTEYMVGRNGCVINRINTVFNSRPQGLQERLANAITEGVATPDYVVILIGINDLVELINPSDGDDWFVPGSIASEFLAIGGMLPTGNGDYRSGGIFIDGGVNRGAMTYGSTPSLHTVEPIKDRYEDLLDDIVAAFPNARVILVTVPIPDAVEDGGDPQQYGTADRPLVKETVESYNLQISELATTDDRFTCVNPNLIRPINTTDAGSPASDVASPDLHDGVHPSVAGYEKIGQAVASEIFYLEWANAEFPMGAAETVRGRAADPDNDGWPNSIEHYLDTDPNTAEVPNPLTSVSGNTFDFTYDMDEDLVVHSVDVEYSSDLSIWSKSGLTRTTGTPNSGFLPVTTTLTLTSWERVFFRLSRPVHQ